MVHIPPHEPPAWIDDLLSTCTTYVGMEIEDNGESFIAIKALSPEEAQAERDLERRIAIADHYIHVR